MYLLDSDLFQAWTRVPKNLEKNGRSFDNQCSKIEIGTKNLKLTHKSLDMIAQTMGQQLESTKIRRKLHESLIMNIQDSLPGHMKHEFLETSA